MVDLLGLHKYFILQHLKPGDTAVDFTMGNGHDTAFLSKTVGPEGHVFAFDIQEQAVASTAKRLSEEQCPENYQLILDSHHRVKEYVKGPIKAGVFNLGYLPGGDKRVTTMRETTLPAIESALSLLAPDGILLIAIYPGHAEGDAEGKAVAEMLTGLSKYKVSASVFRILNSPTSPYFYMVETKEAGKGDA